jgi:hypothetical protein
MAMNKSAIAKMGFAILLVLPFNVSLANKNLAHRKPLQRRILRLAPTPALSVLLRSSENAPTLLTGSRFSL